MPEAVQAVEEFRRNRVQAFEAITSELKSAVGGAINHLLQTEMSLFLGKPDQVGNKKNGFKDREYALKGVGCIRIRMPQDRKSEFKSVPHEEGLLEDLKDMNFVVGYLNSILDGLSADESLDPFLLALGRVAKAHGIQKLAVNTKRTRDAVYKALSSAGNPTFSTLHGILDTMGLQLHVEKKRRA